MNPVMTSSYLLILGKYLNITEIFMNENTNLAVHIFVHLSKYLIGTFFGGWLVFWHFHNAANHLEILWLIRFCITQLSKNLIIVQNKYRLPHMLTLYIAVTISSISCRVIYPSPSRSYMVKAHFSFCSNLPRDVTESAQRNSRKSIEPSPFASKVRNTCSANFDASPYGKKLPYIFLNSSTLKQSIIKNCFWYF